MQQQVYLAPHVDGVHGSGNQVRVSARKIISGVRQYLCRSGWVASVDLDGSTDGAQPELLNERVRWIRFRDLVSQCCGAVGIASTREGQSGYDFDVAEI